MTLPEWAAVVAAGISFLSLLVAVVSLAFAFRRDRNQRFVELDTKIDNKSAQIDARIDKKFDELNKEQKLLLHDLGKVKGTLGMS